ncbi:MAG TPA: DUF2264 domain-containing protein [Falsiroseomonas sp.]|jgi:hypothetical protein|nr:DUF2264 domain-containing protein [Falsiroseomonas sp.]
MRAGRVGRGTRAVRLAWALGKQVPNLRRHRQFPRAFERLLDGFEGEDVAPEAYDALFRYLVAGWATYRTPDGAGALYPGLPNHYDRTTDRLEGFSRMVPLWGAWCASGRDSRILLPDGRQVSLPDAFARGLLAGTDRAAASYWGDIRSDNDQRIVEAADVALALWLFRDTVWQNLPAAKRAAVVEWLSQLEGRAGLDNNWHLFFVLVDRVLTALGQPARIRDARERFERVKHFHLGDGWFTDGPGGRVDFYNAWGFHYALTWIDRIDPEWDPAFIGACQAAFLASYRHLIGPAGLPIMGRSIPYRIAASAPLVAGHSPHPGIVRAGEARRALDATWCYFIQRGALRHGAVTQGYFGPDARIVDRYSGPASSLWSLRSLVMAFHTPPAQGLWRAASEPLPVEMGDFDMTIAGGRWRILGERAALRITIEVLGNPEGAAPDLEPYGRMQLLHNIAYGEPPRPHSLAAKYGRRTYASDRPFCA